MFVYWFGFGLGVNVENVEAEGSEEGCGEGGGEPGGPFVDPDRFEADRHQPINQRWLVETGDFIKIWRDPISGDGHLTGSFDKERFSFVE